MSTCRSARIVGGRTVLQYVVQYRRKAILRKLLSAVWRLRRDPQSSEANYGCPDRWKGNRIREDRATMMGCRPDLSRIQSSVEMGPSPWIALASQTAWASSRRCGASGSPSAILASESMSSTCCPVQARILLDLYQHMRYEVPVPPRTDAVLPRR